MSRTGARLGVAALIALLYGLHEDFWLAESTSRVLGLPASLAWHVGYCAAAVALMALAVRVAWPEGVDDDQEPPR